MDSATALLVAAIGFVGVCAGHLLAGGIRDFQEWRGETRKSKQLIAVVRHEQDVAIRSLLAIEKLVAGKKTFHLDISSIDYLSKPLFIEQIKVSDPINPIALATVLKVYQYISRFKATNCRDENDKSLVEFDDEDKRALKIGIDNAIADYIRLTKMQLATDPMPEDEPTSEEIMRIRKSIGRNLPMVPRESKIPEEAEDA